MPLDDEVGPRKRRLAERLPQPCPICRRPCGWQVIDYPVMLQFGEWVDTRMGHPIKDAATGAPLGMLADGAACSRCRYLFLFSFAALVGGY